MAVNFYGIRDEYAPRFGRQRLTIWSGAFRGYFEGWADELPKHNGFMVYRDGGMLMPPTKIRVECPSPRNESNWEAVDAAINAAMRSLEGE